PARASETLTAPKGPVPVPPSHPAPMGAALQHDETEFPSLTSVSPQRRAPHRFLRRCGIRIALQHKERDDVDP
ncbi:MAG: hypothetical protein ACK50Q_02240, partial [Labrys sp. (in: a-proteobacteria)]